MRLPTSPSALRGMRVLVVGLGTKGGGVEAAKWLVLHGARVTVTDLASEDRLQESLAQLRGLGITTVLGEHRAEDVRASDLVLRNPAVPREAPLLAVAEREGIPVVMDTTLFFRFCPAPIAGITGTRGKSTATAVAGEILHCGRPETIVAGNIERSPLAYLDRITSATPVVLELSSWQLEGIEPLQKSPHWAVLTIIREDHLNRYASFSDYVAAKETLFKYQTSEDVALLPVDDPSGEAFARKTPARRVWFGSAEEKSGSLPDGLFHIADSAVLRRAGKDTTLLAWSALGGTGDHTKRNMLAGALLAIEMRASLSDVVTVLTEFRGLPDRLETVRRVSGRSFVNDTTSTTPEAAIMALRAFPERSIVLIAGGTDKELSYDLLARELRSAKNLRAVVLLAGSATEKLRAALAPGDETEPSASPLTLGPVRTMPEAVRTAWDVSRADDLILLSPGASSFELFKDEFDRGQQFRDAAAALGKSKAAGPGRSPRNLLGA